MKKYIFWGIAGFILITIVCVVITFSLVPLSKPIGRIRKDLLKLTPIGTSMEEVIASIESNEQWTIRVKSDNGYIVDRKGNPANLDYLGTYTIIGEKSIRVSLGKYFRGIYVGAYYGFDENLELIDIAVYKEYDLL